MQYIYSDINVRVPKIDSSDKTIITDTKAIAQSVWRLFQTEEGEIPYYRDYGMNLKKFSHYPLTPETAEDIYDYAHDKVAIYENRAEIYSAESDVDFNIGIIKMVFYVKVKTTNETIVLPEVQVAVGA